MIELPHSDSETKGASTEKKAATRNLKLPQIQLDGYIESTDGIVSKEDPVTFWLMSSCAPFAIDILRLHLECTFSIAGEATISRRD